MDPRLYDALERWAADELRSVNGQIEYLLTDAARRAGRLAPGARAPVGGRPSTQDPPEARHRAGRPRRGRTGLGIDAATDYDRSRAGERWERRNAINVRATVPIISSTALAISTGSRWAKRS